MVEKTTPPSSHSRTFYDPELAAMPNLFLINPKNRAFVEGRSRRAWLIPNWMYLLAGIFLLLVGGEALIGKTSTMIIVFLIITAIILYHEGKARFMMKNGQLIRGRVEALSAADERDSEGYGYLALRLRYTFNAPDGRPIEQEKSWKMHSPVQFKKFVQPKPGAPLAVLYVNDNLYEVL